MQEKPRGNGPTTCITALDFEQVRSDNDASELDILGHLGTLCDNSEDFLTSSEHLDCFPCHFRPFSPIIGSLKKKNLGRMDGRTNGRIEPHIEMQGCISKLLLPVFTSGGRSFDTTSSNVLGMALTSDVRMSGCPDVRSCISPSVNRM